MAEVSNAAMRLGPGDRPNKKGTDRSQCPLLKLTCGGLIVHAGLGVFVPGLAVRAIVGASKRRRGERQRHAKCNKERKDCFHFRLS